MKLNRSEKKKINVSEIKSLALKSNKEEQFFIFIGPFPPLDSLRSLCFPCPFQDETALDSGSGLLDTPVGNPGELAGEQGSVHGVTACLLQEDSVRS